MTSWQSPSGKEKPTQRPKSSLCRLGGVKVTNGKRLEGLPSTEPLTAPIENYPTAHLPERDCRRSITYQQTQRETPPANSWAEDTVAFLQLTQNAISTADTLNNNSAPLIFDAQTAYPQ
jgi:hypothetical protein